MLKLSSTQNVMKSLMKINCAKKQIKAYLKVIIASQSFSKHATMNSQSFRGDQPSNVNK